MAITITNVDLDGTNTKIVTVTAGVVGADIAAALTFAGAAMTDLAAAPIQWEITDTAANGGLLVATNWTISAAGTTGFTVNRIAAGNTSATARVTLRTIHSIDR